MYCCVFLCSHEATSDVSFPGLGSPANEGCGAVCMGLEEGHEDRGQQHLLYEERLIVLSCLSWRSESSGETSLKLEEY